MILNPVDFGAVEGGLVDCADAFNAMSLALSPDFGHVYIPPGKWKLDTPWYLADKTVGIFGSGSKSSVLFFTGEGDGVVYSSSDISRSITMKDFSVVTTRGGNETGIYVSFPYNPGSSWKNCTIKDVVVDATSSIPNYYIGNTSQNVARWKTGIWLDNVAGLNIDNVNVRGRYSTKDSVGIALYGMTVDFKITNSILQFHDVAITKNSALEGFNISGVIGLACNEFVRLWNNLSHNPSNPGGVWGYITNCHSGNSRRSVDIKGYPQVFITNNLFYQDGSDPNFTHIYVDDSDCIKILGNHLQGNDVNNGWNIQIRNTLAANISNNFLWGRYFATEFHSSNQSPIMVNNHRQGIVSNASAGTSVIGNNIVP